MSIEYKILTPEEAGETWPKVEAWENGKLLGMTETDTENGVIVARGHFYVRNRDMVTKLCLLYNDTHKQMGVKEYFLPLVTEQQYMVNFFKEFSFVEVFKETPEYTWLKVRV